MVFQFSLLVALEVSLDRLLADFASGCLDGVVEIVGLPYAELMVVQNSETWGTRDINHYPLDGSLDGSLDGCFSIEYEPSNVIGVPNLLTHTIMVQIGSSCKAEMDRRCTED